MSSKLPTDLTGVGAPEDVRGALTIRLGVVSSGGVNVLDHSDCMQDGMLTGQRHGLL